MFSLAWRQRGDTLVDEVQSLDLRSKAGNLLIVAIPLSPHISIDREILAEFCQKYYIKRLAIFGSALRGDFRPESDGDVLVEFLPGHVPGLDFIAIERELSDLLQGRPVDMVTPKFLSPRLRDQILASAEPLYVA